MVDLGGRESGDLYRCVQQDQFFKLNLQRFEIPGSRGREFSQNGCEVYLRIIEHTRSSELLAHSTMPGFYRSLLSAP